MKNKYWLVPFLTIFLIFGFVPMVSAHVTLHPEESSTDAWEKYSVRVPVEKDMNTTKLELQVPDEVDLVNIMPKDGWEYDLEKDEDGTITAVTWEATEDGIGPDEFTEFEIVAANPDEPTEASWDAYQTYEDDSVVEWTGDEDAEEPAPITEIVEGDATSQHATEDTDPEGSDSDENDAEETDGSSSGTNAWLPIALSGLAILLALISLFRKKA